MRAIFNLCEFLNPFLVYFDLFFMVNLNLGKIFKTYWKLMATIIYSLKS